MRNTIKIFQAVTILASLLATSALANNLCYNLCLTCRNTERGENCNEIESTCNCPLVIDSANSRNMGIEMSKRKLTDELSAGCEKTICVRTATFQDGYYKSIEKGRTSLSKLELISRSSDAEQRARSMQPSAIKAAIATVDSLQRSRSLLPIAPMSQECNDKCNTCALATQPAADMILIEQEPENTTPLDSAALAKAQADSIARADSTAKAEAELKAFCRVTETTCQCKAHEENTAALIALDKELERKTAYADSLLKFRAQLLREEMARTIADSAQAGCNKQGKCRITVTYTSTELALLETRIEEDKPEPAPKDTATAPAPTKPAVEQATASAPADTTAAQPAPEACPQVATEPAPKDTAKKKDERIFYKAMEITYGNFDEHSYYEKDYGRIKNLDDETGYEAGVSYLLRWYFYDAGAISIGMGTFYHYKKFNFNDSVSTDIDRSLSYHNIGLDIPLSFRFGVPFIPIFKPFISQTFHFHKPIFEIYSTSGFDEESEEDEDVESSAKDALGLGFLDDIHTRFNGMKDLTFSVWLGFGLQITRHFSAEYQINFGTGSSGHAHKFESDNYWRVVVDFAW